jgi:hypothetical protein
MTSNNGLRRDLRRIALVVDNDAHDDATHALAIRAADTGARSAVLRYAVAVIERVAAPAKADETGRMSIASGDGDKSSEEMKAEFLALDDAFSRRALLPAHVVCELFELMQMTALGLLCRADPSFARKARTAFRWYRRGAGSDFLRRSG